MSGALVLFDVDGTLLLTHDEVYVEANRWALLDVWGIAPDAPDLPAQTALALTRHALRAAGLDDGDIDPKLAVWCEVFSRRYVELLAQADTTAWKLARGAADVISGIEHRALLTGNPEPVARARLERLGLAGLFAPNTGAFGCERERRIDLFALARARAGNWPAARTVAVGDTPTDVSSAVAAGAHCIAVASGAYDAAALAAADTVIPALADLPAALEHLML